MNKILTNATFALLILSFVGCTAPINNTANLNKNVSNKTNSAAVNSNINAATSSNANTPSNNVSNTLPSKGNNISNSDREFMDKASQGGMTEAQLASAAIIKGQNPEIKAFAQQMINDHSEVNRQIRDLAKQKVVALSETMSIEQTQTLGNLAKLSGAAFDKQFAKMMVEDHEKTVADFQKAYDGTSDVDLKKFTEETLPKLKMHLQMIKEIQSKLK